MPLPPIISATEASSGGSTVVTTTPLEPDTALTVGSTLNTFGLQTTTFVPDPDDGGGSDGGSSGGGSSGGNGQYTPGVAGSSGTGRSTPGSAGSPGTPSRVTIPDPFQTPEPGAPSDPDREY